MTESIQIEFQFQFFLIEKGTLNRTVTVDVDLKINLYPLNRTYL